MTVPITFQVHQMLAKQPMSPKDLITISGFKPQQIYSALEQLVKTEMIVRAKCARKGFVYKVNA